MSARALNLKNIYEMMEDPFQIVDKEQMLEVSGLNLVNKYVDTIKKVCIIDGPISQHAIKNIEGFKDYTPVLFTSFNYKQQQKLSRKENEELKIKEVLLPEIYGDCEWIKQVRLRNHKLTYEEVCRVLNHMMIWHYCMEIKEPVIILEGDAMLIKEHRKHHPRNSINCLSNNYFFEHNENYICMAEPYAYSIDPFCSKNLFNLVMKNGIIEPLNYMIRIDKFTVINSLNAIRIKNNY